MWLRAVPRAVLGLVLVSLLSACASTEGERGAAVLPPEQRGAESSAGAATSATTPSGGARLPGSPALSEIRRRGELLVGVPNDSADFLRRTDGEYRGFDVRMAGLLAEGVGLDSASDVAFRRLPASLRTGALARGSVDVLLGGFDRKADGVTVVAPYVVTGPESRPVERLVGIAEGDARFRDRLRAVLDAAIADGRWAAAADETLRDRRPEARVPELSG
ncbi:hypothetical protein SAMN04487819_10788 [Actinopolyspora alba]|uniref:Solute-binding protein family 3/N-terminal domain-containing protein n=1 Tax=Actinopolyspora alba TaxID=673379 RepID=A0A1I1XEF1_9ACTN|nr:hypothetical protein [Actinopolyspora alba]SFE05541.1 hypothetical protein SAMN04487819_10788 [Actinopolyspora alba]